MPATRRVLYLDVRCGDTLLIDGGRVRITVQHKSGRSAKLRFEAESSVVIDRPTQSQARTSAPCAPQEETWHAL